MKGISPVSVKIGNVYASEANREETMAVELKVGTQGATYSFNESRIDTVLQAKTLNEATRMGFLDSITDFFKGGVKREAIKNLYNSITAPQPNDSAPLEMLDRFQKLNGLAKNEHQMDFDVQVSPKDDDGTWRYAFKIGDTTIHDSGSLRETPGQSRAAFCGGKAIFEANKYLAWTLGQDPNPLSPESFIEGNIQCMTDDTALQKHLMENLDDPLFSRQNFIGHGKYTDERGVADDSKFVATFQRKGDENPTTIVFSNRTTTNLELRGSILQDRLSKSQYDNLRDLTSAGQFTPDDSLFKYSLNTAKNNMIADLQVDPPFNENLSDDDRREIAPMLHRAQIGNTTLGALWGVDLPVEQKEVSRQERLDMQSRRV